MYSETTRPQVSCMMLGRHYTRKRSTLEERLTRGLLQPMLVMSVGSLENPE